MRRRNFLRDIFLFIFALIFGYIVKKDAGNIILKQVNSTMGNGREGMPLADEINALKEQLAEKVNKSEIEDKLTKITPFRFGVVGNANYFNKSDKKWYTDTTCIKLANDDTGGIKEFLNYLKINAPYDQVIFPRKNYLITSSIIIPQECRNIDFQYSTFQFIGANDTYCVTSGAITGNTEEEGVSGGYIYADWKNLFIQCDPLGGSKCNGVDFTRLRNSSITNFTVNDANIAMKMNETWASSLNNCKAFYCNIGISTGRSCNGTNISKANIEACKIGIQIGNPGKIGDTWGTNGLTIDNATLIQSCDTAIELHYIKQASVVNSYFEANNRVIDIPLMTSNDTVHNFIFDSNMIDTAAKKECFLRLRDNSRKVSMSITRNTFTGIKPINTFFYRDKGVLGVIGKMEVSGNWFSDKVDFVDIFPSTWKMDAVKTDILYTPKINTNDWGINQSVQITCLGNSTFELTGVIKRKSGSSTDLLIKSMPYYFTSETLSYNYLISQTDEGASGTKKASRLEVQNLQNIRIYTDDITDLNPINLNGVRWCTRV
ncbi:hypothetical protein [Peribacillus sp. FSL E2-0218]|uniref:hypothetical protein n=1 Tax=Peribacillus sp. FSL E2-0218 TaxID=2921364 RepID=UPI0030EC8928